MANREMLEAIYRIRLKYGDLGYTSDEEMQIDLMAVAAEMYPDLTNLLTPAEVGAALEELARRRMKTPPPVQ